MNTIEAFEKLKQGHKVRRTTWKPGDYIELKSNNIIVDKNGYKCPLEVNMINESWELYDDRKELPKEFIWLKDMHKVYKKDCTEDICEYCLLGNRIIINGFKIDMCSVVEIMANKLNKEYKLDTL